MSSGLEAVELERRGALALLTLRRPEVKNAIGLRMLTEIGAALDAVEADAGTRCLVITGSGNVFSAGGDVGEMLRLGLPEGEEFVASGQRVLERLSASRLPVLAALNGHALGGGLELALACDVRIADERATIGLPEVTLGLIPGWGGTQRLTRLIGYSRACLLVLTGERLTAAEAAACGLVDVTVPAGTALQRAQQIGERIAANSPAAVEAAKRALGCALRAGYAGGFPGEREAWLSAFASQDRVEGLSAFLARRPPSWTGR